MSKCGFHHLGEGYFPEDEEKIIKKGYQEIIHPNGTINRLFNGKLHHATLPAIEFADGSKEWLRHGKWHRTDGPARENRDSEIWLFNGKIHRIDGPAAIFHYDDGRCWYLYGKQIIDPEEYRKILGLTKEQILFLQIKWNWFRKS